jgi:hypothetical protein
VTEDQPLLSGRCPAVFAGNDLAIRTADAERDAVDEQLSGPWLRLLDVDDGGRPLLQRDDGERTHRGGQPYKLSAHTTWNCGGHALGSRP